MSTVMRRRWAWPRWSAIGALGTGLVAIAVADVVNPQYSPISETISRYVNGNAGWLITVALLAISAGSALLVGLFGRVPGGRVPGGVGWRVGRGALGVWAAGVLVAGLFPADRPGQWSHPSTSELVHGMAAWLAFAAFAVAAVLLTRATTGPQTARLSQVALRSRVALRGLAIASVLATATLAVFLADVMDGPSLGVGGAPTLLGLAERLVVLTNLAWLTVAILAVTGRDVASTRAARA